MGKKKKMKRKERKKRKKKKVKRNRKEGKLEEKKWSRGRKKHLLPAPLSSLPPIETTTFLFSP
jgi:hypothetical protein